VTSFLRHLSRSIIWSFVNVIEGLADLTNRLAQAIDQMRGAFMPFFEGIAQITNNEFDNIATAIQDTFIQATPVLLDFFEWFMQKLPGALRFMTDTLVTMQGPISSLGNSIFDFLQSIIDVAVHISQGLAPAFSVALDFATTLINVFETLSNGFLQATLFIGGMVFMLTKFVGIANTAANIGLSAANSFTVLADQIRSSGGVMAFFNDTLSESFRHLDALGKVLTGNMTIAQASGKRFEEVRDRLQGIAEETQDAEDAIEQLEDQILSLTASSQAMDSTAENVGDAMNDIENSADDVSDNVAESFDGTGEAVNESLEGGIDLGEFGEGNADNVNDTLDSIAGKSDDVTHSMEDMDDFDDVFSGLGTSSDTVAENMDGVDDAFQSSLGSFENFNSEAGRFQAGGQFAAFDDVVESVDEDLMKTSDTVADTGGSFAGMADNLDESQAVLGSFGDEMSDVDDEVQFAQSSLTDFDDAGDDIDTPNLDKIRDTFTSTGEGVSGAMGTMKNAVVGAVKGAGSAFARFSNAVAAKAKSILSNVTILTGAMRELGQIAAKRMADAGLTAENFRDKFSTAVAPITDRLGSAKEAVSEFASDAGERLSGLSDVSLNFRERIASALVTAQNSVMDAKMAFSDFADSARDSFDNAVEAVGDVDISMDRLRAGADGVADRASTAFGRVGSAAGEMRSTLDSVMGAVVENLGAVRARMQSMARTTSDTFDLMVTGSRNLAEAYDLSDVTDAVKGQLGEMGDSVRDSMSMFERTDPADMDVIDLRADEFEVISDGADDAADSINNLPVPFEGQDTSRFAAFRNSIASMAGDLRGKLGAAVTATRNRVGAMTGSITLSSFSLSSLRASAISAAQAIFAAGASALQAGKKFLLGLAVSAQTASWSLKSMMASAWGSVTALGAAAISALGTAAAFIGGLIPASISAGTALNVAFAGIPALIGGLVVLAGLAVGVLGNLDGIASGAKSTFDGFKNAIAAIGDALLSVGVPAWNLFVDIIEAIISPVFAIIDGFKMIGQALGIVSSEGGGLGSIIGILIDGFSVLMGTIGAMLDFVAPVFSFLGNLIYDAFIIPFKLVAVGIRLVIAIFKTLFNFLMENVPFVSEFVNMIVSGFDTIIDTIAAIPSAFQSAFEFAADLVDDIMGVIMDMVQPVVDTINDVITASNNVLGTDFDTLTVEREGRDVSRSLAGAQTSASEVRDNIRSDAEEPDEDDVTTEPNVNVNLEDTVENNVEMQADPEDKAQMSRIAKDALEEANSFARRQQGGQ